MDSLNFTPKALSSTPRKAINLLSGLGLFGSGSNPAPNLPPQVFNPAPPQAPPVFNPAPPPVFNPAPSPVFNPAPPQAPPVFNPAPPQPLSTPAPSKPAKRKISDNNYSDPSPKIAYDGTQFTTLKRNIFTQLLNKIKLHPIFSKCIKEPGFDDIITQFIFDTLPRGVDSSLAFLKTQGDINELAEHICQKFCALSVNYPGLGIEQLTPPQPIPNKVLIDLITHRNTELTPTMVKKCVPRPVNQFECNLTSIGSSIKLEQLRMNLADEFISVVDADPPPHHPPPPPPFPCYSIGNYLYSIGPMILDPRGDHIGRNLIMIRVLNYKNHIYPQGIYFWVYPSSSEGGLSRIFFKLPGGVTGATFIKGTDYITLSEEAALESAINEFSIMAQNDPTIISDYETFVCFLGNMPHLQKRDIARYLPTITVSNRYCYQFDMTKPPAVDFFSSSNPVPVEAEKSKRIKSALFFNHIFDYGFNGYYIQSKGFNFAPAHPFNFTTIITSLTSKLRAMKVTFPWVDSWQDLQPVCSFSCIYIDPIDPNDVPGGATFNWLIKNWHLTHNVQGVEIFRGYPHPTVCTLTGAVAYVVGHRGNSFLEDMVPSSVVTFLPPLPVTRLSTYSSHERSLMLNSGHTRSRKPFTPVRSILDTGILDGGPQGTVLPGRVQSIIDKIADFFEESSYQTIDPFQNKLKVCLLTFLDIPPQDPDPDLRPGNFSRFFTERVTRTGSIGLKNLLSIQTATTYVRMLAADTLQTYLGVQPILDAQSIDDQPVMPPRLLVRVSWLGKNHNYIPVVDGPTNRIAFEYNSPDDAVRISNIFNSPTFEPYIIEARRDAHAFSDNDLRIMHANRGLASRASRGVMTPTIPVVVTNKTMLFRVIIYNDTTNNPDDVTGSESVKFGALEVIVSISSTAVYSTVAGKVTLHFGTDVQFSVVSITACRHTRRRDGVDHFEKVQTFHGTNADIESVGIWGTNKLGDYAATVIGVDQYHPEISEFLRLLLTIDAHYNSVSVSPYNTPGHWIMKVFAPVLKNDNNGQELRDRIFEKWQWQWSIRQIKQMGNVLRLAANLFFSDQEIQADQVDDGVGSRVTDDGSSDDVESIGGVMRFLRDAPLAPENDNPTETPKAFSPKSEMNSSDEGSEEEEEGSEEDKEGKKKGIMNYWGEPDTDLVPKPGPRMLGSLAHYFREQEEQRRLLGMKGGRRHPRLNKTKTTQKYRLHGRRYRTNKQKQKSTNANTKNKNKNIKTIKTIKNNKRLGSNKSKPKPKSKPKSKSNLKCKRRMNMNTATRRRCRTT